MCLVEKEIEGGQSTNSIGEFNAQIRDDVGRDEVFTCVDASVKGRYMGGHYAIVNYTNTEKIEGSISTDQWKNKSACCAESQIMLEVIRVIEEGTRDMTCGKITTCTDNKKLKNMMTKDQQKANDFAQEAGATLGAIMKKMRKIKLTIEVEFTKGHPSRSKSFDHDPVQWTMTQCDKNSKKERVKCEENLIQNSVLTESDYVINMDGKIDHNSTMQLVKIRDAQIKERECAERKFGELWRCVDIKARNVFTGGVRSSVLKSSCGYNHCNIRENLFNKEKETKCPRCMNEESWDHVIRCPALEEMRNEYCENMKEMLSKIKFYENKVREVQGLLSDVKKYFKGEKDFVASQVLIGFDKIFRGYVVKDWCGDNETCESCHEFNKVIVKKSVEFYNTCWDHRNSCMNKKELKRKMVLEWHEKAKQDALNSEYPQVVKHVKECDENMEIRSTEYMQRWIQTISVIKRI